MLHIPPIAQNEGPDSGIIFRDNDGRNDPWMSLDVHVFFLTLGGTIGGTHVTLFVSNYTFFCCSWKSLPF